MQRSHGERIYSLPLRPIESRGSPVGTGGLCKPEGTTAKAQPLSSKAADTLVPLTLLPLLSLVGDLPHS